MANRREEMQKKLTFNTQVESGMLFRFRFYIDDKENQFKAPDVDQWFDQKIFVKKHKFSLELSLQFKESEKFISLRDILNIFESKGLTLTDNAYAGLRAENETAQKKLSVIPAGTPIPSDLQLFEGLNDYFNPTVKPVNQHKAKVNNKASENKVNSTKTAKPSPKLEKPKEKPAPTISEKREIKFINIFISKDGLYIGVVDHSKKLSLDHVKFWFKDFADLEIGEFKDQTFIITLENDKQLINLVNVLKRLQKHQVHIPEEILEKLRQENYLEDVFVFKGLGKYLGKSTEKQKKPEDVKKPKKAKVTFEGEGDKKAKSAEDIVIPEVKRKWLASGKAPKVSADEKMKFMSHPDMKNAIKLKEIEGDIQEALLNLVDYGAKLYSEYDNVDDKKSKNAKGLKLKLDSMINLISTTLSQDDLSSSGSLEAIKQEYIKLETADKNRGTGFYRVYSFFKRKYFEGEDGKTYLLRSTTGELAYNLFQALQKNSSTHESSESEFSSPEV